MNLTVNVRGVSGSGKSTAVRSLFARATSVDRTDDPWCAGHPQYYRLTIPNLVAPVFVVGDYEGTKTAGAEGLRDRYATPYVFDLFDALAERGHVVAEGFTLSQTVTMWIRLSKVCQARGAHVIVAHLTTTVDECVANIMTRRETTRRISSKLLNVDALRSFHKSQQGTTRSQRRQGVDVRDLPWRESSEVLFGWFQEFDAKATK